MQLCNFKSLTANTCCDHTRFCIQQRTCVEDGEMLNCNFMVISATKTLTDSLKWRNLTSDC